MALGTLRAGKGSRRVSWRQRVAAHGHWTTKEVLVLQHRLSVDTGTGFSAGGLSAVVIDGEDVRVLKRCCKLVHVQI